MTSRNRLNRQDNGVAWECRRLTEQLKDQPDVACVVERAATVASRHAGRGCFRDDHAEDLFAEILAHAYPKIERRDPTRGCGAAYAAILVRSAIGDMADYRKAKKRNNGHATLRFSELDRACADADDEASPFEPVDKSNRHATLDIEMWDALRDTCPYTRDVFECLRRDGLNVAAIAKSLNRSEESVKCSIAEIRGRFLHAELNEYL